VGSASRITAGQASWGREKAEVLVDSVTYVACSSAGLNVGGELIPYVAGSGEDGALDAIREYLATIDTIARRIEDALVQPSAVSPTAPAQRAV
jgi:hypothetical protein